MDLPVDIGGSARDSRQTAMFGGVKLLANFPLPDNSRYRAAN
jgi:hypothetical protein